LRLMSSLSFHHSSAVSLLLLAFYLVSPRLLLLSSFSFQPTATTEIYTLSLHDALPILMWSQLVYHRNKDVTPQMNQFIELMQKQDRKSTRLNSSHVSISYAVFCLKKKKKWYSRPASRNRHIQRT